jgi:hypothetical protein
VEHNHNFSELDRAFVCVCIYIYICIEKQQIHQNDHFIVIISQTFLHVSAYQRHHQGAHMILTSCLSVGVHYRRKYNVMDIIQEESIMLWILYRGIYNLIDIIQEGSIIL